jgi:pyruvate/2-oxoglutarate dehydrogenase complex dihydrolipoamide acyltransferase (E2) component
MTTYPEFNSNFNQEKLENYSSINLGHFINLGQGAKLAVIENAEDKSLAEFSREVKEAALKYIRGELTDSDASTFAITNLASFDAFQVIPPIYENQSSMFAIASEFNQKFNLTLSYDARVADCQRALKFLNAIKEMLEN